MVAVLTVVTACSGGCAHRYLVTRRSADVLPTLAEPDLARAAVPASDGRGAVYVRATRLVLVPGEPAPPGLVRARAPARPRHPRVLFTGVGLLCVGAIFVLGGAAVAASPTHCSSGQEFCGSREFFTALPIMGVGGGIGLVGIVLIAIGGANASAEVAPNRTDLVYLPR
jgi:hypothetical protein